MAQTIASIQGLAYRETPPFVYELPTRSPGDATHATRALIGETAVPVDAVDLVARVPQGTDSKPAPRKETKDQRASADPKADVANGKASEAEQRELEELRETDRRVRAHEQAHMCAGGGLVRGGPTYQYKTGPDGQRYAVSGEVQLDTSPVNGNPLATKRKAERIRRAALAPADPSPQDRHAAAQAEAMANRASQEQVQAKLGTGPKTSGVPAVLSPDAMPQDRPAVVNDETKKGSPASQQGAAPMGKPTPEQAATIPDPTASAEAAVPFEPTPQFSAAFSGQALPAMSAYQSPSSLATKARLNILV